MLESFSKKARRGHRDTRPHGNGFGRKVKDWFRFPICDESVTRELPAFGKGVDTGKDSGHDFPTKSRVNPFLPARTR